MTVLGAILEEIHGRLAGVVIECLPFAELIAKYDRPHTLFYLDPPYWGSETDYGEGVFSRKDFGGLAEQLATLTGRFLLSLNDRPEVRDIFRGFQIERVKTGYSVNGRRQKPVYEVLISGPYQP